MAEPIREKVSGVGSLSERTDLNVSQQPVRYISGLPYGEGQATYNQQTAAPMAENSLDNMEEKVVPITAFSNRASEPITTGVDIGAGAGSEILPPMPRGATPTLAETFGQLLKYDTSGDSELIYRRLVDEGY